MNQSGVKMNFLCVPFIRNIRQLPIYASNKRQNAQQRLTHSTRTVANNAMKMVALTPNPQTVKRPVKNGWLILRSVMGGLASAAVIYAIASRYWPVDDSTVVQNPVCPYKQTILEIAPPEFDASTQCLSSSKRLLTDLDFVDLPVLLSRFSIQNWGAIPIKVYCPPILKSKIDQNNPEKQRNPNPLIVSKFHSSLTASLYKKMSPIFPSQQWILSIVVATLGLFMFWALQNVRIAPQKRSLQHARHLQEWYLS